MRRLHEALDSNWFREAAGRKTVENGMSSVIDT